MQYEGMIYRPPSEAFSLLIQVTVGCTHNKCTFCNMYKEKRFHIRSMETIFGDLEESRRLYGRVPRIFLCDGDALCLSMDKLGAILDRIAVLFPECEAVNVYGNARDVLRKEPEELRTLREKGVRIIYIGAESGSDRILRDICKGSDRAQLIQAVRRIEDSGIRASVTFISGIGGKERWREHARETGTMISAMSPSYAGLLTLMTEPGTPLYADISAGRFQLLNADEVLDETALLLQHIQLPPEARCVFRSNHASNYLSLKGDLPQDREAMLSQIRRAKENAALLRPEWMRGL